MLVGVWAVLLGGAVGLAVPATREEGQLMGPARDRLVERVQETVQDTTQKVQQVAEEAQRAAVDEARDQGLTSAG